MQTTSNPLIAETYKGYTINVWPNIHYPPFKDFYANAWREMGDVRTGFFGIGGESVAGAVAAAKSQIDLTR